MAGGWWELKWPELRSPRAATKLHNRFIVNNLRELPERDNRPSFGTYVLDVADESILSNCLCDLNVCRSEC